MLVPRNARRLGGLSDVVISLYAGGMTVRDISHHLHRVYGTEVGPDTISTITDEVLEEVKAWQHRPLDEVYPIVYVDALVVKVRDGGAVRNKSCYLVVGVGVDGSSMCWASGCSRPKGRNSGCRCAPSCATGAYVTC